ncbi:MAG: DUF3786 domain-containing protein [Candidatus Omnitrophica bacterium]|nr:DUF3786 domain-containing protein [Candidatus Omnitrophota bacterium]
MAYDIAINKAWEALTGLVTGNTVSVKFLQDEYSVDFMKKTVTSLACNVPAKDFTAIILLHYLAQKFKGLPELTGEWLTFRELAGIEGYYPAFRERAIEPVIRKYGNNPEGIFSVLGRLPARIAEFKDVSIIIDAFPEVPVLIKLIRPDQEFGPDANILFDRSTTGIFCTEDIIVLAGIVAAAV